MMPSEPTGWQIVRLEAQHSFFAAVEAPPSLN
jgi:hypothetical protein